MANKTATDDAAGPQATWERVAVFCFGAFFCGVLAYAGLRKDPITPQGFYFLRVLSAISAAGIAAFIPGFIHLNLTPGKGMAIRAGGALAVFLIIYKFNPPELVAPATTINASDGSTVIHGDGNVVKETKIVAPSASASP